MSREQLLSEILKLPEQERLDLIDEVYESIPARTDISDDMTPEFRAELDRRIAHFRANPDDVVSWDEASARILQRFKKA